MLTSWAIGIILLIVISVAALGLVITAKRPDAPPRLEGSKERG